MQVYDSDKKKWKQTVGGKDARLIGEMSVMGWQCNKLLRNLKPPRNEKEMPGA